MKTDVQSMINSMNRF